MVVAEIFGPQVIILIVVLVVVFGGSQLPKLARNVGTAGREFRKAQEEAEQEEAAKATAKTPPQVATAPTPPPVAPAPAPAPAAANDQVTLSKAELNALLDEREARAKGDANN